MSATTEFQNLRVSSPHSRCHRIRSPIRKVTVEVLVVHAEKISVGLVSCVVFVRIVTVATNLG